MTDIIIDKVVSTFSQLSLYCSESQYWIKKIISYYKLCSKFYNSTYDQRKFEMTFSQHGTILTFYVKLSLEETLGYTFYVTYQHFVT